MAYPFASMPTLDDFVERVGASYGVERRALPVKLRGPRGDTSVGYLVREIEGETARIVELPAMAGDQRLLPNTIRHLCRRLEIDPADFGLTLG